MSDIRQKTRMTDDPMKDLSLIHQVGQPPTTRLLFELRSRAIAFLCKDIFDSRPKPFQQIVKKTRQNDKPNFVESNSVIRRNPERHKIRFSMDERCTSRSSSQPNFETLRLILRTGLGMIRAARLALPCLTDIFMSRSAFLLLLIFTAEAVAADRVDYLRDIKPVLAQKCFACHGALKQQSGLRLDTAATIRTGGDSGPAIVAGKPIESLLLKRVSAQDADSRMPPEGEGEPLDSAQLAKLKTWIEQGAEAPDEPLPPDPRSHWAYKPPIRPAVPATRRGSWVRNPIDAFIAADRCLHRCQL